MEDGAAVAPPAGPGRTADRDGPQGVSPALPPSFLSLLAGMPGGHTEKGRLLIGPASMGPQMSADGGDGVSGLVPDSSERTTGAPLLYGWFFVFRPR